MVFGRYAKTMPVKYLPSVRSDAGKADSVLMGMKAFALLPWRSQMMLARSMHPLRQS